MRRFRQTLASLAVAAAVFAATAPRAEVRVVELSEPVALAAFELADGGGKSFTPERLKDQWTLLLIGYTSCPDVCPFVLTNLADVIQQMSVRVRPDNLPKVVFVGVDPKRDKPIIGEYVQHFGPAFVGVTGETAEIDKLVKSIDGFYRFDKPDKDGFYTVQHTASVIVVGPDARVHAKLSPPLEPGSVAEYLARQQIAYRRKTGG